jgi:hypothetical protein
MTPDRTPDPLDLALRVFKEIMDHSRHRQEGLAGQQPDLPSVTEILTIAQFGFPRTYHLNDGMGPDLAGHSKSVQSPGGGWTLAKPFSQIV